MTAIGEASPMRLHLVNKFNTYLSLSECLARVDEIADYCAINAAAIDIEGAFPVQEFERIAKAGLLGVPLMPEFGGLGLGIDASLSYELLLILKKIGWGNLAVGRIFEGHVNALQIIQTFGTRSQIERYASDARDRHKIFGVWNAEANDGVKVIPLKNGGCKLQGSKTFCSGTGHVERPFVNGLSESGWQMCIVPMDRVQTKSDSAWWKPCGMRATASYKIDFSNVELDPESLIGGAEDYNRQPWLSAGAIRFTAVQLGGAEALFDATRQYLQSLNRTNDPYQEARIAQMAIALESGNLWLKGTSDLIANYAPRFGGDSQHPKTAKADYLVNYVNMARTAIEEICMDIIQLCQRSVGTSGLLPPYPMERIIRDLSLYLRQPSFDATLQSVGRYELSRCLD
jgi:alkylation response protein AidB-like acyl-CoA dehydrogenase